MFTLAKEDMKIEPKNKMGIGVYYWQCLFTCIYVSDGVEAFRGTDLIPLWMDSNHLDSALCQIRNYHRRSKTFDSSRVGCDEKSYYICDKGMYCLGPEVIFMIYKQHFLDGIAVHFSVVSEQNPL